MQLNINELVTFMNGELVYEEPNKPIEVLVSTDQELVKNALYFMHEVHDNQERLINKLNKASASGVVIKSSFEYNLDLFISNHITVILVPSISMAYYQAAKYYRQLFSLPVIEITGSAGKTTTKEMVGCILDTVYQTLVGEANYNAPRGVAYNLSLLKEHHEVAVLEAGMKDLGIIDLSSDMIHPTIGAITCIQRAHLTSLKNEKKIIKAKQEMLPYIKDCLIMNGDDALSNEIDLSLCTCPIYRIGLHPDNDLYATDISYNNQYTSFIVHDHLGESVVYYLHGFGDYMVRNALIAIKIGLILDIPHDKMVKGLKKFHPIKRRQQVTKLKNGTIIINDNYNANPESTIQLVRELPKIRKGHPLVLVFGDIERYKHENEDYANLIHYEIGEEITKIEFDHLLAIGPWSKQMFYACSDAKIPESQLTYCENVEAAKGILKQLVKPGTLVVFKAQHAYIDLNPLIQDIK